MVPWVSEVLSHMQRSSAAEILWENIGITLFITKIYQFNTQ